MSKNLQFITSY
jgi:hypothetical protein